MKKKKKEKDRKKEKKKELALANWNSFNIFLPKSTDMFYTNLLFYRIYDVFAQQVSTFLKCSTYIIYDKAICIFNTKTNVHEIKLSSTNWHALYIDSKIGVTRVTWTFCCVVFFNQVTLQVLVIYQSFSPLAESKYCRSCFFLTEKCNKCY